jgi:hypothetical protein
MTGHNRRNGYRTLIAVVLTAVMVTSVFGMGFMGSAAAAPNDAQSTITSTPAEYGAADVTHVATLVVDSNLGGTSIAGTNLEIDYSSDYTVSGFSSNADVTVEVIDGSTGDVKISDGTAANAFFDTTNGDGGSVATQSTNNVSITASNTIGGSPTYAEGDIIRVVLSGGTIDNVAEGNNERVTFNAGSGTQTADLGISLPGPIEVDSGGTTTNHSSLAEALSSISSDDARVTIGSGTHYEFNSQTSAVEGGLATATAPSNNNLTISGEAGETNEIVSTADTVLDLSSGTQQDHEVSNLTLEGGDGIFNSQAATALIAVGGTDNVNIDSNSLLNTSGDAVSAGDVNNLEVTDNQIDDPDDSNNYNGVTVSTANGNSLDLTGNTIENVGSGTAITVSATASDADVTLENNVIDGSGSGSGTGVSVASSGASDVDVGASNSEITNVSTGITTTGVSGDYLNVSDATLDSIGTGSGTAIDLSTVSTANPVNVTDVTINASDDGVVLSTTGAGLTVQDGVFGEENGALSGDAISITDSDTDVDVDGTTIRVSGSNNGITTTSTSSYALNVTNVDVSGDSSSTGIHVSGSGVTLELDESYDDASTISGANVGLDVQTATDVADISNTTFDNIENTDAIQIASTLSTAELTFENITVSSSGPATAIDFASSDTNLNVQDSSLGAVANGVVVNDANTDVTVEGTSIDLSSAGIAIDATNNVIGNSLTVANVTITGADSGTGINVNEGGGTTVNIDNNANQQSSISGVDTGIHIQNVGGDNLNDISNTSVSDVGSDAIVLAQSGAAYSVSLQSITVDTTDANGVRIDDGAAANNHATVTLTADSSISVDGQGTGVAIDNAADVTVEDSTVEVADDSNSVGVHVNDGDLTGLAVNRNTITAAGDSSAGTGVIVDASGGTLTFEYNDILGFTGDGYGLDGSDVTNVDATANWWGDEFGPQNATASNVDVSSGNADVYDPFLTANTSTQVDEISGVDSLDQLSDSDITQFGHSLVADNGDTVAFPGTSENTIENAHVEFDGMILGWNATGQSWETVTAGDRPEGLDAYKVVYENPGDSQTVFLVEYASETDELVNRGAHEYQQGWNLVASAKYEDDITAGVGLDSVSTFNFEQTSEGSIATTGGPDYAKYSGDSFANTEMDTLSGTTNALSPFEGYWVYAYGSTVDERNGAALDPSVTLADVEGGQLEA